MTDFTGDTAAGTNGLWTATPPYRWSQNPAGSALAYVTAPLRANTTVVGAGQLTAWVRSSARNADLQVTVTEVRPDGREEFVQSGWLRGDERALDRRKSKRLEPVLSLRKRDVRAFPRHRFVKLTVPLYYQGHAYRAGSRIRVIVSAPNGDQPIWAFSQTQPRRTATIAIAHSRRRPSRLTLPVVAGVPVTGALPPCPGLRGEPCRAYQPLANRTVKR
jgi:predicted acyl esterase